MLTETLTASHTTRALLLIGAVRNSQVLPDVLSQLEEVVNGVVNRVEQLGGQLHYQPMTEELRAEVKAERRRQGARAMTAKRPPRALPAGSDAAT